MGGFYRDIEINPTYMQETEVEKKERELEGVKKSRDEDVYQLIECHVNLDLEGFEDRDEFGEPTGIKLPYVVTIEAGSREVLSIRRNYQIGDPTKQKTQYFVHFKFLPGLGFYGFGLIHMIGGLSRTATSALRQLLDAGTLSNLPLVLNNEAFVLETKPSLSNLVSSGTWTRQVETLGMHSYRFLSKNHHKLYYS